MSSQIDRLHHVTAISGAPQRNLDFYANVLGLRFVKRTVNFDDRASITCTTATKPAHRARR